MEFEFYVNDFRSLESVSGKDDRDRISNFIREVTLQVSNCKNPSEELRRLWDEGIITTVVYKQVLDWVKSGMYSYRINIRGAGVEKNFERAPVSDSHPDKLTEDVKQVTITLKETQRRDDGQWNYLLHGEVCVSTKGSVQFNLPPDLSVDQVCDYDEIESTDIKYTKCSPGHLEILRKHIEDRRSPEWVQKLPIVSGKVGEPGLTRHSRRPSMVLNWNHFPKAQHDTSEEVMLNLMKSIIGKVKGSSYPERALFTIREQKDISEQLYNELVEWIAEGMLEYRIVFDTKMFSDIQPELYKMDMHDIITPTNANFSVVRVPGGWLYAFENYGKFIPLHPEFDVDEPLSRKLMNLEGGNG